MVKERRRKGRWWGARGRSGWSRFRTERRRSESERNRLDRANSVVTLNYKCNGFFLPVLFSSRIPSNTHTVRYVYVRGGKKRSRGFVRSFVRPGGERGGEAHANLSRRFFCSCFLAAVAGLVTRVDSVAPMKRWRTANARRQHIPVLPNGPRYTPRRTFPRVFFSPRASPPPVDHRFDS